MSGWRAKMDEASMRRSVFLGAGVLAAVITLAFGIDALRAGLVELGVIDLSVSAVSAGILLAAYRRRNSIVPNWIFVAVMASFFLYLFASGGHGGTGLLFMLLIPLSTPLFLGWRSGVAVSVTCMLICVALTIYGRVSSPLPGIPEGTLLARAGAIYAVSLILSSLYDAGMNRAYGQETRAKEALRQSEERYRTILDETGDGYFELDLAGNLTFGNDAMMRLLGSSGQQAIGMNYKAFLPGEEEARVEYEAYNRMYKTGEPLLGYPSHIVRIDGSHGFAETSAFPIRNEKGEVVGFRGVRRDITERRRAEEALRTSEEKYRLLSENASDVIWTTDMDLRFTYVSPSAEKSFGYAPEELTSCAVDRILTPPALELSRNVFQQELAVEQSEDRDPGRNRTMELEVICKNGLTAWVEARMVFLRDEAGHPTGILGIARDITERKRADETLEIQRAYFQQLFDGSPDAIIMLDTDDRVRQANRGFEMLFGYSAEEITGRSINDLVTFEDRARESSSLSRAVLHGRVVRREVLRRRKDGRPLDVSVVGYPIRFDGRTQGIYVIYSDITKRKKAEDALRRSEERYRSILEEMEDAYFEVDLGGHLSFVNGSVCRDLGYSREELIGMSYKHFIADTDLEAVFRMFNDVYVTGIPNKGFAWKTVRKDGSYGYAETSVSPLRSDDGRIVGFRGIGRDITERRKMQEQLLLTDRLASIGQLTSGIAHELNNPLTGVIGFSDLLLRRDLPADIKEDIETVNREARRTSTVVKSLLAFSRQHGTEKVPMDINSIIEEVLRLRSYEQRVNNIEVETQFASDLPQVLGNGAQLQQVFVNIIINAEQAMLEARGRGKLTVTTERVRDVVRASIGDDGPGIKPFDMDKLFTPFFTTKEVGKGTGLGLSICHGIVTEHGGAIYAESMPGAGATFVVELPIAEASGEETQDERTWLCGDESAGDE